MSMAITERGAVVRPSSNAVDIAYERLTDE
jgi:hypothetical protein